MLDEGGRNVVRRIQRARQRFIAARQPLVERNLRMVIGLALPMTLAYMTTPILGLVDTAVVGRLGSAALIGGLESLSDKYQVTIVNFGHAGNGNIHVNLLVDPDDPLQMASADPCLDAVFDLVLSLGGSLSGEHGIGWVKREFVTRELGTTSLQLMTAIKRQFDPDNILNPGVGLPDS